MMDAARYRRIEELFGVCCDMPADTRSAYLDDACRGNAELRAAYLAV